LETDESGAASRIPTGPHSTAPVESAEQDAISGERNAQSYRGKGADWVDERLQSILESLLFAAGEPVTLAQLANAVEEVPRERIRKALSEMAAYYATSGRGFALEEIAGGYQLRTPSEHAVYVRRLLSAKPPRLSRPVLETLAIIAYRQPVTRPEIEQLRGVDSGGVLDTLIERNLIKIGGRKDAPGRPILYATTSDFLELFGLKGLDSLPDLEEFRDLTGPHDPAEAAASLLAAETANNASFPDKQDASETTPNEQSTDLSLAQPQENAHQATAGNTSHKEDESLSPQGNEATRAENDDEPEGPR
jgi:segregation and condensation protein B